MMDKLRLAKLSNLRCVVWKSPQIKLSQRSNSLMTWSLDTAEHSLAMATASARPAIQALDGPITKIDQLLCQGIDIVEQRVPAVHLPPQLVSLLHIFYSALSLSFFFLKLSTCISKSAHCKCSSWHSTWLQALRVVLTLQNIRHCFLRYMVVGNKKKDMNGEAAT